MQASRLSFPVHVLCFATGQFTKIIMAGGIENGRSRFESPKPWDKAMLGSLLAGCPRSLCFGLQAVVVLQFYG